MRLMLACALFCTSLQAATLDDQFDKPVDVPGSAQTIFFAGDMDAGDLIKDTFGEDKQDTMAQAGVLYVADISAMPGLIFKLFAKSSMQDYPYRMALDKEGELTAQWPRQEGAITVIQGQQHQFCTDGDCLKQALGQ